MRPSARLVAMVVLGVIAMAPWVAMAVGADLDAGVVAAATAGATSGILALAGVRGRTLAWPIVVAGACAIALGATGCAHARPPSPCDVREGIHIACETLYELSSPLCAEVTPSEATP